MLDGILRIASQPIRPDDARMLGHWLSLLVPAKGNVGGACRIDDEWRFGRLGYHPVNNGVIITLEPTMFGGILYAWRLHNGLPQGRPAVITLDETDTLQHDRQTLLSQLHAAMP